MKIVFMGTPEFAIPSLQAILDSPHQVVAVVTVTDKPTGRGLKVMASPIKQLALENNLPILQPEKLRDPQFIAELTQLQADLFVVIGFRLLPEEVFSIPPLGTINVHASLLPRYRGAAPINWAIIRGETITGITIFYIDKTLDTGHLLIQERVPIKPDDHAGLLHDKLAVIGAEILIDVLDLIQEGKATVFPQEGDVTLAPKITREICKIDWQASAVTIHNLVRGLSPTPGAFTSFAGKILKIFTTQIITYESSHQAPPGTIVDLNQKSGLIAIATGNGVLALQELQLEGKKCMSSAEFLRGCRLKIGDQLL
ncbi:methionyl-tRNA formyltransferase [candidate division KSB1 bacterium]|nr:methionyl-tRNA formyltransferase [candidate division KSB1 bacterium]